MKEYRCEICGERFRTPQGLSGHRQWKHGLLGSRQALPAQLQQQVPVQAGPNNKENNDAKQSDELAEQVKQLEDRLDQAASSDEELLSRLNTMEITNSNIRKQLTDRIMQLEQLVNTRIEVIPNHATFIKQLDNKLVCLESQAVKKGQVLTLIVEEIKQWDANENIKVCDGINKSHTHRIDLRLLYEPKDKKRLRHFLKKGMIGKQDC